MQLIAQQLGSMFAGAIPTMILFVILVVAYQVLIQGPLTATLKRRRELTEGAMEAAQRAIAEAEARTTEHATRLRLARSEVYRIREQRLQQWTAERDSALDATRKTAAQKLSQAKAGIEAETATARQAIQASAGELAGQVVRAVLPVGAGGSR
jgi:F-type H+-transporting ATPase subunit b